MGERFVFFGKSFGLGSQDQCGDPVAFLAHRVENFGKPLRVFRLSEEEIDRVCGDVFGNIAVCRASQKNSSVAVTDKILLQKTGNKVFLHIKDRLHGK